MWSRLLTILIAAAVVAALAWVYMSRRPELAPGPGMPAAASRAPAAAGPALSQQPVPVVTAAVERVPLAVEGASRADPAGVSR